MQNILQSLSKVRHSPLRVLVLLFAVACSGAGYTSNPPSAPSNISVSMDFNGDRRTVVIEWGLSYDSDGWVIHYELLKNNSVIYVGDSARYVDTNIRSGVTYNYTVVAVDNNGDRSFASNVTSITISSGGDGNDGGGSFNDLNLASDECVRR